MIEATAPDIVDATDQAVLELTAEDRERMEASATTLEVALKDERPVYGVTRGFGPLGEFAANDDSGEQGLGLINHLSAGQLPDLPRRTSRLMLRLRLEGMKRGYSGVHPERWQVLADIYNAGFVPVVPSRGSVSASGDLVPLAHAAHAFAGRGQAWIPNGDGHRQLPADEALARLGIAPMRWDARDALAFVNGSSASLAVALENHAQLRRLAWAAAALTGWAADLLQCNSEPYNDGVVAARGRFPGHQQAAVWIRDQLAVSRDALDARTLQEPYSLRCAPQVIGSVLDHLQKGEELLVSEAQGCSDNPIVTSETVLHAGNFHAINVGLVTDAQALLAQQLAFLAERQLAVVVEPASNGGLPPLLASRPGATSGLAGLQLAASAMLAEVRQKSSPVTTTPVPTNLSNQDIVPVSLIGCLRTAEQLELTGLILGSLAVAVAQASHILSASARSQWSAAVLDLSPRLEEDRPISREVGLARDVLVAEAGVHVTSRQQA